jgi:hypothetical protein
MIPQNYWSAGTSICIEGTTALVKIFTFACQNLYKEK